MPQLPNEAPLIRRLDPASQLRFERISIEQGLSQSSVRCIAQDGNGFPWFGTEDGLNRYDGYEFKVYKHDPDNPFSLGNNAIQALYADSTGGLWIGTEAHGLDRFDREKEQFVHYRSRPADTVGPSHNNIRALYEDTRDVLWIGTGGGPNQVALKNR